MKNIITLLCLELLLSFFVNNKSNSQWQSIGPEGGQVKQLWSNNQDIYVMGYGSGMFKSTNDGQSWYRLNNVKSSTGVFYGIGSNLVCSFYNSNIPSGLYYSSNAGLNWSIGSGLPNNIAPQSLSANGNTFYLYWNSPAGFYISDNFGVSWTLVNSEFLSIMNMVFTGSTIYASTAGTTKVIMSTNNGSNWINISGNLPPYYNESNYAITVLNGNLYKGYGGFNVTGGIYKTTNNGQNWFAINNGLSNSNIYCLFNDGTNLFAGTQTGVFKSTNGGDLWSAINSGTESSICKTIIKKGSNLFAGYLGKGGLYKSSDSGNNWTLNVTGFNGQNIYYIANMGNKIFATMGGNGVWKTLNNGINWTKVSNGLPNYDDFYADGLTSDGANLFLNFRDTNFTNRIYKSSDEGNNWINSNSGITSSSINCIEANNNTVFAGTNAGLFVSTNSGNNWTLLGLDTSAIRAIAFQGTNNIFLTTSYKIFQSTNSGVNWIDITGNLQVLGLREIEIVNQTIIVTQKESIHRRNISGGNWSLCINGLPANTEIEAISIINGNYIMIGIEEVEAIYLSDNLGDNWINVSDGSPRESAFCPAILVGTNVFVGTDASLYKRPLSEIIGIQNISTEIPGSYSLSQNFPNPFNPVTNINFDIIAKGNVKLFIYDILGRKISTLVNEVLQPGSYKIDWDAANFPSGVYFYKLEAGSFSETKKMILIK